MWIALGFLSAILLGIYDICKKRSVEGNAVLPVLLLSMSCSTLLLTPLAITKVPSLDWHTHLLIFFKACLVLGSGMCGYYGIKHVPLTIAAPIGATRPMWVIMGAVLIFGERLEWYQWIAVSMVLVAFMAFSLIGRKEGFSFRNPYIWLVVAGMLFGAASGVYDKHLLRNIDRYAVQFYYAIEQALMMLVIVAIVWWPKRNEGTKFQWRWSIVGISLFWVTSDLAYFHALSMPDSMLSILSVIRRTGTIIPFTYGAVVMKDANTKPKAAALAIVLVGVIILALTQ